MTPKKLDVKEALNATPASLTNGTDAPSDSYDPSKSRAGKQPDPIALTLYKGERKQ